MRAKNGYGGFSSSAKADNLLFGSPGFQSGESVRRHLCKKSIDADPRISIHPLDRAVIDRSQGLAAINEMHDRQIVATALVLADGGGTVALLTHDGNITAARLVPVVWKATETAPAEQEQA